MATGWSVTGTLSLRSVQNEEWAEAINVDRGCVLQRGGGAQICRPVSHQSSTTSPCALLHLSPTCHRNKSLQSKWVNA